MKTGSLITLAAGGFRMIGAFRCGVVAFGVAVAGMAAASETTSFSPIFVKDGSGKFRTLTWTYVINGGEPLAVDDEDTGLMIFKFGDLKLTINPSAKTRQGSFSCSISGDAQGSATAKFTEALEPLEDHVAVASQKMNMSLKLTEDGLRASVLIDMLTQFTPGTEWFLDRSDLDQLGVGFSWDDNVWGEANGTVKISIPGYGSNSENVSASGEVPDYWTIVDVLDCYTVGSMTYRNVVVVERLTQVPTGGMDGGVEEAVLTYWVAQGVGMVRGVGQYQFMGEPLEIALKAATLKLPEPGTIADWAQGAYTGFVEGGGVATMNVFATGKVTGKLALNGLSYGFSAVAVSAGGCADVGYTVSATAKAGQEFLPLELYLAPAAEASALGLASGQLGEAPVMMWRNVWSSRGGPLLPLADNYYTASLPGNGEFGSGYLTFTVDKKGQVKAAGKLADGTAVSQSGTLVLDGFDRVFAVVYTAPAAYKGGSLFGLVEFVYADTPEIFLRPLDSRALTWESRNPQATAEYGVGFVRNPWLFGGRYDKTINLRDHYANGLAVDGVGGFPILPVKVKIKDFDPESESENPPKITRTEEGEAYEAGVSPNGLLLSLNAAGTAFTVPKSPAPSKLTDPETGEFQGYNYGELENPSGLTFSFVKATGLFKGGFNVYYDYVSAVDNTVGTETRSHVAKKASFEGVFTPVRLEGNAEGGGFILWAGKGYYENDAGKTVSYPFSWSFDFLLR